MTAAGLGSALPAQGDFPFTCTKDTMGVFFVGSRLKVSRFLWIFSIFFLLRKHQEGQRVSAAVIPVFLGFDSQALDLSGWRFFPGFPASSHSPETCTIGSMVHKQLGMSMMKRPLAPGVTPPPPQHPMTLSAREVMIEMKASKMCFFFFFFFAAVQVVKYSHTCC